MFERKCVTACMNMKRSAETEYIKYISNQKLYDRQIFLALITL